MKQMSTKLNNYLSSCLGILWRHNYYSTLSSSDKDNNLSLRLLQELLGCWWVLSPT